MNRQVLKNGWVLTYHSARPYTVYVDDERNGTWSDSGVLGPDGIMRWDFPERVPESVRKAARTFLRKQRGGSLLEPTGNRAGARTGSLRTQLPPGARRDKPTAAMIKQAAQHGNVWLKNRQGYYELFKHPKYWTRVTRSQVERFPSHRAMFRGLKIEERAPNRVGTAAGAAKARAKKAAKAASRRSTGAKLVCRTVCRRADGTFKACR